MARRQYRGNTQPTTLASPVGLSDTTATLVDGSSYPDGTVGPFTLTIDGGAAGEEKWLVTSRTGNGLTGITRAYDGTSAASHNAGAGVKHTISAVDLDEANAHLNDATRDDHTQYGLFKKGLASLIGAAGRAGKMYYKTDLDYLTYDDGSAFHDFPSKAVTDGAYLSYLTLPADALAPAGGSPVLGVVNGYFPVWLLSHTTTKAVTAVVRVPDTWNTVKVDAYFTNAGAGAGNVAVRSIFGSFAVGDTLAASGDTVLTPAAPAANALAKVTLSTSLAVAPGKAFLVGIERQGGNAGDTLTNDIGLVSLLVTKAS
jgi:hypothetical protein